MISKHTVSLYFNVCWENYVWYTSSNSNLLLLTTGMYNVWYIYDHNNTGDYTKRYLNHICGTYFF